MGDGISRGLPWSTRTPLPSILYRSSEGDGCEDIPTAAAQAGWRGLVTPNRTAYKRYSPDQSYAEWLENGQKEPEKALVIGRYSVLPYYDETAADLGVLGYRLANSSDQHKFCADIKVWSGLLADFTPKTYTSGWDRLPEGGYVLKGATNSRKTKWNTHMYAPTKADVPAVFARLLDDTLIGPQGIVAREYIPLRKLGEGINGCLFTHEFRLFYWGSSFIAGGFYWSSFEDAENFTSVPTAGRELGDKIAAVVAAAAGAQFFVLDVAETATGDWILIEVNDGQMSGLSEIDPVVFYSALWSTVCRDLGMSRLATAPVTVTSRT